MAPRGAPWWMTILSTMPACPVKTTRLRMSLTRTPGRDRMDRLGVCLALALLGGLVVGACQAPAAAPAAVAPTVAPVAEPLKVRWGGQRTLTDAAAFVALDRGYFREEGIDLDYVNFGSASEIVPAVATNQLEVG